MQAGGNLGGNPKKKYLGWFSDQAVDEGGDTKMQQPCVHFYIDKQINLGYAPHPLTFFIIFMEGVGAHHTDETPNASPREKP